MATEWLREKLLRTGAKNLREFGYPNCTKDNILDVMIFRSFFRKMVEETMEEAPVGGPIREACASLLAEIDAKKDVQG